MSATDSNTPTGDVVRLYHSEHYPGLRPDNHYEIRMTPEAYVTLVTAARLLVNEATKYEALGLEMETRRIKMEPTKLLAQLEQPPVN